MPGFNAETYRAAASEHITAAQELYFSRRYGLCFYVAGLAVECILRAYIVRRKPQFDARHDIRMLFRDSGLSDGLRDRQKDQLNANVGLISVLWENQHRFRSEFSLRRFLKSGFHDRGIRGDLLKENARRLISAATQVVLSGENKWTL
jgi:HEPN domain-containing protein